MADDPKVSPVELITDPEHIKNASEPPLITVRTGQTDGQIYHLRVNQPQGRAVTIALHL